MALRFETIKDYPAYEVVKFAETSDAPTVFDDELLYNKETHTTWKLGSCVGYALKSGHDPIEAYNRALENGHETHYAFGIGACISNNARREQRRIAVEYGDKITFHGQVFVIERASNDNITLKLLG